MPRILMTTVAVVAAAGGLFAAADPVEHPYTADRVGVCSWSWATNMTTIVDEMDRMGVKCMQLSLIPWVQPLRGIEYPASLRETFGKGETGDAFLAISNKIARGEISVLSTMISFPNDCWGSYLAITNSNGIMCNADLATDATGETLDVDDPLGEGWWMVGSNLVDQAAAMTSSLGVEYLSSSVGFLMKPMIDHGTNANENAAIGFRRLFDCQRICSHYGVKLLLETGQYSGEATRGMIDAYIYRYSGCALENGMKIEDIALNFDVANHLIYGNDNPTNAYVQMRARIPQVHVKDTFAALDDRLHAGGFAVDVKWGTADASQVFHTLEFLKAEGFSGNALVEHEAGDDRVGDIKAALRAILLANNDDPSDGWINPAVMLGDDDERCGAALKANGFSDRVSEKLSNTGLYGAFKSWAVNRNFEPDYLAVQPGVILAAAYDASSVPAPEDVGLRIADFVPGDTLSFTLHVDTSKAGFNPNNFDRDLFVAAIDVEGTHSLGEGFSREGLAAEFGTPSGDVIPVSVRLDDDDGAFFLRVKAE